MTNPFAIIPAKVRLWLYLAYALAGLALGSVSAYAAATQQVAPDWVAGAGAVLLIIGTAFGFTAASNVAPAPNTAIVQAPADVAIVPDEYAGEHRPEAGRIAPLMAVGLGMVALAFIVLALQGSPVLAFLLLVTGLVIAWYGWYERVQRQSRSVVNHYATVQFKEPVDAATLKRLLGDPLRS